MCLNDHVKIMIKLFPWWPISLRSPKLGMGHGNKLTKHWAVSNVLHVLVTVAVILDGN